MINTQSAKLTKFFWGAIMVWHGHNELGDVYHPLITRFPYTCPRLEYDGWDMSPWGAIVPGGKDTGFITYWKVTL